MIPIFDGHNDTLRKLYLKSQDGIECSFLKENDEIPIELDLLKARRGGLKGGMFSINVPNPEEKDPMEEIKWINGGGYTTPLAEPIDHHYAQKFTDSVLEYCFSLENRSEGKIKIVKTLNGLEECFLNDIFAIILHFEGAEAIDKDLENLEYYYNQGLRVLAPVWSRNNQFGCGVPFSFGISPDIGSGLTVNGKKLIEKCNELGITIDVSHMNEASFWDTLQVSKSPIAATHSNAYSLSHSTRNLTDKQIKAIGDINGVIGVNFNSGFIRKDGVPKQRTSITELIKHIEYIIKLIGLEGVALGSDFDGAIIIKELKNASKLPNLIHKLEDRGFTKKELEKISYKNWFRVLDATW